ncbi:hypothetical protein GALL_457130 [mine drainage metagenome]|uniref:Uncharacterized protein n=1 Tax=mine drainage metagenome TaxID=410659 RepID=A0A1J5PMB4_9ZZZZ
MKMKFNAKAAAVLARQFDLMAHEMFVVILGLSAWKGTAQGVFVAAAVWLVFVLAAFWLRSLSEDPKTGGDEDESG